MNKIIRLELFPGGVRIERKNGKRKVYNLSRKNNNLIKSIIIKECLECLEVHREFYYPTGLL